MTNTNATLLNAEQQAFVEECCGAFFDLTLAAGVSEAELTEGDAGEVLDAVVRWWHDQAGEHDGSGGEGERPDFATMCNILGVAMGELLRSASPGLAWRMVRTDDEGEAALTLWRELPDAAKDKGQDPIVIAPIDAVMGMLVEHPDGFFQELLPTIAV